MRLVPIFDWADEGVLFDPTTPGTPWDDVGEFAHLEIMSVYWPGLSPNPINWYPIEITKKTAKVEIKDGGFAGIWADADNDGTLSYDDYKNRRDDVGSLLVVNSSEKAEYYVWIDVVGSSRGFDISFVGMDAVQYVDASATTGLKLDAANNLRHGFVDVTGTTASNGIDTDGLTLNVKSDHFYMTPQNTSDWARMTVFSVDVDMAFNHDRGNNTGTDGINIRTDGSSNTEHHAPEIRNNAPSYKVDSAGNPVINPTTGNPEMESWASPNGSNDNATVLYLADDVVTSYNRFVVSPHIPGLTLSLEATAAGLAIGGWKEEEVTFNQGLTTPNPNKTVSTGTKAIASVAGFVEFEAKSNTSATVDKEVGAFVWNVNKIQYGSTAGKTSGIGAATTTAAVTVYTVLNVPKDPWNVNDSVADDKKQPWVSALEFTIETAGSKGNDVAALSQLTTFLHSGHGLTYDTASGANVYYGRYTIAGNFPGHNFDVTRYVTKGLGNIVNCYDQAAALTTFGRLLGMDVRYTYLDPFGYINQTTLVSSATSSIITNSPFFASGYPNSSNNRIVNLSNTATDPNVQLYRRIYDVDSSGTNLGFRTSFGRHAYATLGDAVYDACAGPIANMNITTYFSTVVDFAANIHDNQFKIANSQTPRYYETAQECVSNIVYFNINDVL